MPTPFYLAFDHAYRYPEHRDGILIPVSLQSGGLFIKLLPALIREPVSVSFRVRLAKFWDWTLSVRGIYQRLGTLTGGLDAFGHEINLQTFDIALTSTVYFAREYYLPRNLLGRVGWLNKLRFGLIDYDQLIYLSQYDG